MEDLYIFVLRINGTCTEEIANEKLDFRNNRYVYDGLALKILLVHGNFVQLSVYAYNPYTAQLLNAFVDNCGARLGVKYDIPVLIETDERLAGARCSYVFQISKQVININKMYQKLGIGETHSISYESYNRLKYSFYEVEKVVGFHEMMHYIDSDKTMQNITQGMVQNTVVYGENFTSCKTPQKHGCIQFQENLMLKAAKPYAEKGRRVAILNFANPIEPGGGVLRGADAQEEGLCRSSNLYKSLVSENARNYYSSNCDIIKKNQFNSMFIGTDMVIYSPNVLVLKEHMGYKPFALNKCREAYQPIPYNLDVLTCAAPFFSGSEYILPNGDLENLLKRRIRNIFEIAIENSIEVLILGAFGCGAFHNPPEVVASAFRSVLLEERYANAFDKIVFAIKRKEIVCPNIEAFERNFSTFPNINNDGNEKRHRLSWKWVCTCGFENAWDNLYCERCKNQKRNHKNVKMYNS